MPPSGRNEKHVVFKIEDGASDTQPVAGALGALSTGLTNPSEIPRVLIRTPTLPTGGKGEIFQVHPGDQVASCQAGPVADHNDVDFEVSSASGSGSRNDDSSSPRDRDGTVSPTSSRSESPSSDGPTRNRSEDLAGLASNHGGKFPVHNGDSDATVRPPGDEDEHDHLEVRCPSRIR